MRIFRVLLVCALAVPVLADEGRWLFSLFPGKVWDEVAAACKAWAPSEREYQVLEFPMTDAADPGVRAVLEARYQQELRALKDKQVDLPKVKADGRKVLKTPKDKPPDFSKETSASRSIAIGFFWRCRLRHRHATHYVRRGEAVPRPHGSARAVCHHLRRPLLPGHAAGALQNAAAPGGRQAAARLGDAYDICHLLRYHRRTVRPRAGELVGITFDGNIEGISLTYLYSDETARAVHLATQGIVEVLRKLYKTTVLLDELRMPQSAGGRTADSKL